MREDLAASLPEKRWYALYTRSRHEKCIDLALQKQGVESYLPLRKIKRRWSDRTVAVEEPFFKSYLFVKTHWEKSADVLKTKGAVKFVSVQGRPLPVDEKVVDSIKNIFQSEIPVDPFPYLNVGERVFVRSGVFKDIEGFIIRKDSKKCRLVISIDALRASMSVEVDSCLVEKV